MKSLLLAAVLSSFAAHADATDTRLALRDALEAQAELPADAPALPTQASDRARTVQATIAFGQKGTLERTAHARANDDANSAARHARAEEANRAAQNAADASQKADDERQNAAGQTRAAAAHDHATGPGANGNLNGGNPPTRPVSRP